MFRYLSSAFLCVLIVAFASGSSVSGATIKGKVDLTSIQNKKLNPQSRYGRLPSIAKKNRVKPVAIVYLEGDFSEEDLAKASKEAELAQQYLQFSKNVLPVLKGTRVAFPNFDETYHNVFSYSKVKSFDLGRYNKKDPPQYQVFDQAGEVKVFCEIHDHMRSTIVVLETPYFVSTDDEGNYELPNLPEGEFTLKVRLKSRKTLEKAVTLKADDVQTIDF